MLNSRNNRNNLADSTRNLDLLNSSSDSCSSNSSDLENRTMAVAMPAATLDDICKALRLVPDFDGNPNVLVRFVNLCDQLVATYGQSGNQLNNSGLLNGILNKVVGPAARQINANGIPNDWTSIRNSLINNFADQRDETALYNDLAILTQGPSTPQEFYERCQNLFSTIMTYVSLHESLPTTIDAKRDLYQKLTLQAFLRGLKDPLGSRIRCMRPETIEKALEYVHDEMNTMYIQSRNLYFSDKKVSDSHISQSVFKVPLQGLQPFRPMNNMPGPTLQPFRPQFVPRQPLPPQHQFRMPYQPRMPSRTQQMFSAPPPNYQRGFPMAPTPQSSFQGPKPMSGVSHFLSRETRAPAGPSGWNWAKQGNPPPSNYFKTRDVNVNECLNYDCDGYEYYDYGDYNYDDGYCGDYYGYSTEYDHPYHLDSGARVQVVDEQPESDQKSEDFPKDPTIKKLK